MKTTEFFQDPSPGHPRSGGSLYRWTPLPPSARLLACRGLKTRSLRRTHTAFFPTLPKGEVMNDEAPQSIEALIESARRNAGDLSPHGLDEQIAVAVARRDVASSHGLHSTAETWQRLVLALADVRSLQHQAGAELDQLVCPVDVLEDGDTQCEPPC